jgi:alpha-1,2-mannosyltransferase
VRAQPAAAVKATVVTGPPGPRWLLPAGALLFAGVLAVYVADLVSHLSYMAAMRDLVVYRNGGLIVRHVPPAYDAHRASPLYDWTGQNGVQFTYPPFAAVVFAVASVLPWTALRWAMTLASLAALVLSLWLTFGALSSPGGNDPPQTPPAPGGTHRPRPPLAPGGTHPPRPPLGGTSPPLPWQVRLGATLGVSALALATEPVQQTLALGQVNLLLMLLLVADLLTGGAPQGRTRWWHGFGIGIAAGVKLTPLIFIPYLLLIRRYRQAATATAVFAATVALGYAIVPRDSGTYWGDRLVFNANRIVFLGTRGNQSLRGVLARLAGSVDAGTLPWVAAAVVVVIAGLAAAALLYRAGQPVPAMLACALTGLLVSPLSWDHHWVWVAPGIALLAHLGARARGLARAAWWAAAAALFAVFACWPQLWDLSQSGLTPAGLVWYGPGTYFATGDKPWYHEFHWHGLQLLAGNSFVLAGLVALAALVVAAVLSWPRRRPGP